MIRLSNTFGMIAGLIMLVVVGVAHGQDDYSNIPPPGPSGRLVGVAVFHDADTLVIAGIKIRLSYVDAPEIAQVCKYRGVDWKCGIDARDAVIAFVDGQRVICNLRSFQTIYKRWDAVCYTPEGIEINEWVIRTGWARAYPGYATRRYLQIEELAKLSGLNIWQPGAVVQDPWQYRQQKCTGLQARSEYCRSRPDKH